MLMRLGANVDLERHAGLARGAAGRVRLGERSAGALALVSFLGVAVETHLYRSDRQPREPLGDSGVEALPVALDLELDSSAARAFRRSRRNAGRPEARRRRA